MVRSVQRGTITVAAATGTLTISAVDTANSVVSYLGGTTNGADVDISNQLARIDLTNATTITMTKIGTGAGIFSVQCVEYWPGVVKSKQVGTIALNSVASNTATIATVNTAKSVCEQVGYTCAGTSYDSREHMARITLTNATTVTANRQSTSSLFNITYGYQIVEFY